MAQRLETPILGLEDERAWRAVMARDASADGRFVYAVRSTGIYCRPSCPSRRPARKNVRFFSDGRSAEREGFRPCRRCGEAVAPKREAALRLVRRASEILGKQGLDPVRLDGLAAACGVSPFALRRTFTRITGVSPRAYADALRFGALRRELRTGQTVSSATYAAGFGSSSRLYEHSQARLGMTPAAYRRGGAGELIGYTLVPTGLGLALIAATDGGVCAVKLGDAAAPLERDLRREFPNARAVRADDTLASLGRQVRRVLDGSEPAKELPLDIKGTAFQARVWQALRRIPRGETRTYSQVARAIGRPNAVRAVASACASNHLAVVVPCHRVVRKDGGLGGYRWGIERKQALLEREAFDGQ